MLLSLILELKGNLCACSDVIKDELNSSAGTLVTVNAAESILNCLIAAGVEVTVECYVVLSGISDCLGNCLKNCIGIEG